MNVETCPTKGQTYECFLSICNANNFGVKTLEVSAFRPDSVFTRNFNWGTLGCENWVLVFVWQGYELGWQALILGALNSHFWSLDHVFYTLWVVKSSLWKCWRPSLNSPNFPNCKYLPEKEVLCWPHVRLEGTQQLWGPQMKVDTWHLMKLCLANLAIPRKACSGKDIRWTRLILESSFDGPMGSKQGFWPKPQTREGLGVMMAMAPPRTQDKQY